MAVTQAPENISHTVFYSYTRLLKRKEKYSSFHVPYVDMSMTPVTAAERVVWRRALCKAVQCMRLYCRRHPLSAAGWHLLLAVTLSTMTHMAVVLACTSWWHAVSSGKV